MSLFGSQDRHLSVKISIASKIKAYKDICLILQKAAHPARSPLINYKREECKKKTKKGLLTRLTSGETSTLIDK